MLCAETCTTASKMHLGGTLLKRWCRALKGEGTGVRGVAVEVWNSFSWERHRERETQLGKGHNTLVSNAGGGGAVRVAGRVI